MKIFKIIGIVLIAMACIIGVAIFAAPSEIHISRSTIIDAPSKLIYQDLLILKNFLLEPVGYKRHQYSLGVLWS